MNWLSDPSVLALVGLALATATGGGVAAARWLKGRRAARDRRLGR